MRTSLKHNRDKAFEARIKMKLMLIFFKDAHFKSTNVYYSTSTSSKNIQAALPAPGSP